LQLATVLATCLFKERELSSVTPSNRTEATNGILTPAIVRRVMAEALVRSLIHNDNKNDDSQYVEMGLFIQLEEAFQFGTGE